MSTSSYNFFAWDWFFKTIEETVTRKSDVLIALAHFELIRNGSFRCVDDNAEETSEAEDIGSELLPSTWNDDEKHYSLRYILEGKYFSLVGSLNDNRLILNLYNERTQDVSNIMFDPEKDVNSLKGSINELVPNATALIKRIRSDLIYPFSKGQFREVTTQTAKSSPEQAETSQFTEPITETAPSLLADQSALDFNGSAEGLGASDLNALGGHGQGNLFPLAPHSNPLSIGQPRFDPTSPDRSTAPDGTPDPFASSNLFP